MQLSRKCTDPASAGFVLMANAGAKSNNRNRLSFDLEVCLEGSRPPQLAASFFRASLCRHPVGSP